VKTTPSSQFSKAPPVAVAPGIIGPENCEAFTGVPKHQWNERVRESGVPYRRLGHLVLVRAEDALRAFGPEAVKPSAASPSDPAEAVRSALGLRRRAGR